MEKSRKRSKDLFLETLQEKLGLMTLALRTCGLKQEKVDQWIQDDPDFAKRIDLCNEIALDYVEGKMYEKINAGDVHMIRFFLETRGKKRGYYLKKELETPNLVPVILTEEESLMFRHSVPEQRILIQGEEGEEENDQ